jgi:superfamily I DNA and RNA helicase
MENTWWVGPDDLIDEQSDLIDLPADKSYLIKGPPGSGKTNLLLLRANFLTLAGHVNLRVVVFTRMLQSFLAAGAKQYDFKTSRITTLTKWEQDLLFEYGVKIVDAPQDFEKRREYLTGKIEELVETRKLENLYDVTLLDEAQDYLPSEIRMFRRLSKTIFAVADSRQKIYEGEDCMEELSAAVDTTKTLQFHHRCGIEICRLADALTKDKAAHTPMEQTSNYDEDARPSQVKYTLHASLEDEATAIIGHLATQMKAYPGELLGVICPKNEDLQVIWKVIQESEIAQQAVLRRSDDDEPFDPDVPVWLSTMHSFKGLEARALHIAGLAKLGRFPNQRNLIFTSVTRAKTALRLYSSGDIPDFLTQALKIFEPQPAKPKIVDAFGKKK